MSIFAIIQINHILILLPFSKEGEILKTEKQEIGTPKKKGLGDIMGGRVLKLETDKIIAESLAQGISQGIMQEKMDALERVTRN